MAFLLKKVERQSPGKTLKALHCDQFRDSAQFYLNAHMHGQRERKPLSSKWADLQWLGPTYYKTWKKKEKMLARNKCDLRIGTLLLVAFIIGRNHLVELFIYKLGLTELPHTLVLYSNQRHGFKVFYSMFPKLFPFQCFSPLFKGSAWVTFGWYHVQAYYNTATALSIFVIDFLFWYQMYHLRMYDIVRHKKC